MIDFDPAAPFPELRQLWQAVQERNWPAVAAFFDGLTDPDDQTYATTLIAEIAGSEHFLWSVVESGGGTLARTLLAARLIVAGWEIRTAARAQHVSREQFAAFHDHLRRAERILIDVTALEPANVPAWVARLKTNRGLQLGLAEARRRYDRLSRHVPHVYAAQGSLVQQFCQKWGGSDEQAHRFGVECMRGGPEGSLASLALVEAHIEIGMDWDDDRKLVAHLRQADVRAELHEAADRSVRHPAFRRGGYHAITAHNLFALVFSKMGDFRAAADHFQFVGDHGTGFWGYFGDEKVVFSAMRSKTLKAVRA
ncbi:hypothetical protein Drose_02200 [Dactylosporangium roseum]|uniref:DUF4034 domain-containing protein n=1 Tax=Dactylosporangium roseum TaxID=47989 RepID=A0ABY5Z6M8_9ACTN|nr:hypothetical protein [Dactylosporangium roseum]UWZ37147.1 hypothetical protein Drose_02200 [Dactylosporangium roseum]